VASVVVIVVLGLWVILLVELGFGCCDEWRDGCGSDGGGVVVVSDQLGRWVNFVNHFGVSQKPGFDFL
jgi:hypothetical protein